MPQPAHNKHRATFSAPFWGPWSWDFSDLCAQSAQPLPPLPG